MDSPPFSPLACSAERSRVHTPLAHRPCLFFFFLQLAAAVSVHIRADTDTGIAVRDNGRQQGWGRNSAGQFAWAAWIENVDMADVGMYAVCLQWQG